MMTDAIDIHHRVIRELIRVHNGYEVKTEGDAFMVRPRNSNNRNIGSPL